MSADFKNAVAAYLKEVNAMQDGQAAEHTYRIPFAAFIQRLDGGLKLRNDPGKVRKGGNPDFLLERGEAEVGIIETKDIGADLDAVENSKQMARYLEHYPNLVLTDYIRLRWYRNGQPRLQAALARPGKDGRWTVADAEELEKASQLMASFLGAQTEYQGAADDLATRMARIARELRDRILSELQDGNDFLDAKLQRFREELIHDMDAAAFADMYAQTVAYGLFTARYHHGGDSGFGLGAAASDIPVTSPFLRNLFNEIATINLPDSLRAPVEDLIALLKNADQSLRSHFGEGTGLGDPVIHFYETFLKEYDPKLRELRGVYYTPDPVVDYIVRSVDALLRSKFGFKDGLASSQKIRHPKPAKGRPSDIHELLILDPATGTGTFLHHVIREIYKSKFSSGAAFQAALSGSSAGVSPALSGKRNATRSAAFQAALSAQGQRDAGATGNAGLWDGYVARDLLPRIHGFEFLMAPYAIAHLKLGLLLKELGYKFGSNERLRVFLTNTLEEARESKKSLYADQFLEMESRLAQIIKREDPVMVILGNPPYSGHSANNGEWIAGLLKGKDILSGSDKGFTANYFAVNGQPLGERNPKWLNDDYVKFIRWAQWRIEQTGSGILAFVTNHGYLDNPTFRGMRQSLLDAFDEIYILDLHGNSKKKEKAPGGGKDENVFDIMQGVAIGIFVKRSAGVPPSSAGILPALSGSSAAFQAALSEGQPDAGAAATGQGRQDGGATMRFRKGLPHLESPDGTYFVTFRLADSLPAAVVEEYKLERDNIVGTARQLNRDLTAAEQRRLARLFSEKVESLLDNATGECWLARPEIAAVVDGALRHFDGQRYHLLAHCVMPNHVHAVFTPLNGHKLDDILHSWKSFTANEANSKLGRKGAFWQREYYDHLVRDKADLDRVIQYTLDNPVKAGLKDWKWSSAGFQPALSESQQDAGATASGQGRQDGGATVYHAHLFGPRPHKYAWLGGHSVNDTPWTQLDPQPPFYLFVPQDTTHFEEYQRGFKLTEAMPVNGVGMTTARDHVVIDHDRKALLKRAEYFRDPKNSDHDVLAKLEIPDKKGWSVTASRKLIQKEKDLDQFILPVMYRPFDRRLIFYHDSLVWRTVKKVMHHMVGGGNVGLLTSRQTRDKWDVSVANSLIAHKALSAYDITSIFPLYLQSGGNNSHREANFSSAFRKAIEAKLGGSARSAAFQAALSGKSNAAFQAALSESQQDAGATVSGQGRLEAGATSIFNYIYAILHSPTYRQRYAEYLKMDFPRIPITSNRKLYDRLAALGGELVQLHLCGEDLPGGCAYPVGGGNEVEKPVWEGRAGVPPALSGKRNAARSAAFQAAQSEQGQRDAGATATGQGRLEAGATSNATGRVRINKTQYFDGIEKAVWEFQIGGYQPAQKWLKDRKGRTLSHEELSHYPRMIHAMRETARLMGEIDKAIDAGGGWPVE